MVHCTGKREKSKNEELARSFTSNPFPNLFFSHHVLLACFLLPFDYCQWYLPLHCIALFSPFVLFVRSLVYAPSCLARACAAFDLRRVKCACSAIRFAFFLLKQRTKICFASKKENLFDYELRIPFLHHHSKIFLFRFLFLFHYERSWDDTMIFN